MMNNTYSLIISQSERAWSFQWARALFALERRLGDQDKWAHLRRYSINLAASSADQETGGARASTSTSLVPGLMIIKRIGYTRAERRRLVVGHWQVSRRGGAAVEAELSSMSGALEQCV